MPHPQNCISSGIAGCMIFGMGHKLPQIPSVQLLGYSLGMRELGSPDPSYVHHLKVHGTLLSLQYTSATQPCGCLRPQGCPLPDPNKDWDFVGIRQRAALGPEHMLHFMWNIFAAGLPFCCTITWLNSMLQFITHYNLLHN